MVASHMEEIWRSVRELASIDGGGPPVLSLYLDTKWSDQHQRDRVRLFLAGRAAEIRSAWKGTKYGDEVGSALEVLIDRVMLDLVNQGEPADTPWDGFAFFASPGRDLWMGFRTRIPFLNELHVQDRPSLVQLARVLDEQGPAFVVLVDGRFIRIFELAPGSVLMEVDLEQYLPDRVDAGDRGPFGKKWPNRVGPSAFERGGGMSQMRYQRHIRDHLEHNLEDAGQSLAKLSSHEVKAPVVLCGEEELRALFKRKLPDQVRRRVAIEMKMDSRAPRHEVMRGAMRALDAWKQEQHGEEIERVVGQALGPGLAVLGTEDTILAIQQGRLHTLYVDRSADFGPGWACETCPAFGRRLEAVCPFCGSGTYGVDLLDDLVRRALATETRVVIVDGNTRLRHFRGLAGSLRTGLQPTAPGVGYAGHEPLPPR